MVDSQVVPGRLNSMRPTVAVILILVVCVPIMFWNLDGRDLWAPDEPRFAQIAREMVRAGDWIVPRMNGQNVALLPPLTYWLVAVPSAIQGDVTEFTARLPIAVTGLIGVLATFFLGRRMYGTRGGLFSALILATSFKYLWQARWLQADMALTAFVTLALLFFHCGFTAERRKWVYYHLFCIAMGFAVLAKGPLGIVLPGLVILPFLTWTRSWRRITEMWIPTGIIVFLLVVVPWYVAVGLRGGEDFLREVVIKHNFGMFFKTWSHKKPVWFYLPHVFWLMMPWSLFIFPALFIPVAEGEKGHKRFLLCWVIVQFLFFSVSQAKQEKYLLPIFPAAAILIGKCWVDYIRGALGPRLRKAMTASAVITALEWIVCSLAAPIGAYWKQPTFFRMALGLGIILFVGGVVLLAFLWRNRLTWCFTSLVVFCVVVHLFRVGWVMPRFNAVKSAREFCRQVNRIAEEDEPLGIYGVKFRQIGAYCFYADRRITTFENKEERFVQERLEKEMRASRRFLCMVKDSYLAPLQKNCPGIDVTTLYTQKIGHRLMHLISNGKEPKKGAPEP